MTVPSNVISVIDQALSDARTDGANTAAADAQQQIDALTAQLSSAQGVIDADEALIGSLNREIDRLEAIINGGPIDPPPPGSTLIGASIANDDGGLNVLADIRPVYNAGALPADFSKDSASVEASTRTRPGGVVWASYKGHMTETALRVALTSMSNYLASKGQVGWVTSEHEPDAKPPAIVPSVYHAEYDLLERVIAGFTNLDPIVCLTGFKGDKGDLTSWNTYWRPGHPVIGADHYNMGHQKEGEPLSDPATNWGHLVEFAKFKGKPLAIRETGVGPDAKPGPVVKTRPDWYEAHREYALDGENGIVAAVAFDSGKTVLDQACAKSWYNK